MDIASRILLSTKYFTGFYFETPAMSHMEEVKQSRLSMFLLLTKFHAVGRFEIDIIK